MRHLYSFCLVTSCALHGTAASAEPSKLVWVGELNLGYSEYEFKPKIDTSLSFPIYSLSLTGSYERVYVSLSYGGSISDADVSEEEDVGDSDRRDIDITVGYQVTSNFGVFGGWRDGRTQIDFRPRDSAETVVGPRSETYQSDGLFVGGSYRLTHEQLGSFALSVAYAWLDADNDFVSDGEGADPGEAPEFDDITGNVGGDTNGFSYAISWTKPLAGQLLYRAQLKFNDYQQDLEFQGQRFDNLDQRFLTMTMGLSYVF